MAVPLNRINPAALAALAGNNIGNLGLVKSLNLPVAKSSPMGELGKGLAMLSQQAQQRRTEERQDERLAKQDSFKERALAMQERRLGAQIKGDDEDRQLKREMFQKKLEVEGAKAAKINNEEQLRRKAGAGIVISMLPDKVLKDKNKRNEIFNILKQDGIINDQQQKALSEMDDPEEIRIRGKSWAAIHKEGLKQLNAGKKKSGQTITVNVDTGEERMPLSKAQVSKQQGAALEADELINRIASVRKQYSDKFLGYKGRYDIQASKIADNLSKVPGLGDVSDAIAKATTGMSGSDRDQFIQDSTRFINEVEQLFQKYRKATTGAQASDREIKMLREIFLNAEMTPNEFIGALEGLMSSTQSTSSRTKKVLKEGVNVSTPQFSDDEINAYAKKHGISREKVLQMIKDKQEQK